MNHFKSIFLIHCLFFFGLLLSAQTVEVPEIDYVTVNQAISLPIIHWSISDPAQINGYAVKRFIRSHPTVPDNTWHTVKQINNPNIFSFEDNSVSFGIADPNIQSEIYEVTAYKIIDSDTILSLPSSIQKTIYLTGDYDYCSNQISLKWSNYFGWGNNFIRYEIYEKENSGSYTKISETSYNDTTYFFPNLQYNTDYTFYIKALRNDGTESLSNLKLVKAQAINLPTFLNINSVTVENENKLNISVSGDSNADIDNYSLFKSSDLNMNYSEIENIQPIEDSFLFTDNQFDADNISYYYVTAKDYCGKNIFYSDTVSNIVLLTRSSATNGRYNNLHWADMYNNSTYQIFRSAESDNYEYINQTESHQFTDNIQDIYENQFLNLTVSGTFCYYVKINIDNFINKSNVSCAKQEETVFFPNAFNPKSTIEENRVFKPKAAFISDYHLTIYGSFGNILFESNNKNSGWDGTLKNGELAPVSSYLYFSTYKNTEGKLVKIKNYVTLVY